MAVLACTALAMMMKMGEKKITMTMILMKRFYVDSLPDEVVGSVHLGFASMAGNSVFLSRNPRFTVFFGSQMRKSQILWHHDKSA